jgi:hypothetical protein
MYLAGTWCVALLRSPDQTNHARDFRVIFRGLFSSPSRRTPVCNLTSACEEVERGHSICAMNTEPINPSAPCAPASFRGGTLGDVGLSKIDASPRERFRFILRRSTISSILSTWRGRRSSTHRLASPWLISPPLCSHGGLGARHGSGRTRDCPVLLGLSGQIGDGS